MARKPASADSKSTTGASLRELHERVQQGRRRGAAPAKVQNKLAQAQNRWQRTARYGWDKNRGRG